jgi:hypothetical protein
MRTLGRSDFIRVPLPADRTMATLVEAMVTNLVYGGEIRFMRNPIMPFADEAFQGGVCFEPLAA